MTRGSAIGIAVVGGLLLVGGTAAPWIVVEGTRQIAEVSVPEVRQVAGLAFAPLAVPLGVLAALCGPALALRATRRIVGALVALLGLLGGAAVGAGVVRAMAEPGRLAAGPAVAVAGAVMLVAAGWLAVRRPAEPGLPPRYTVEGAQQADDDEWQLASDEDA